MLFGKNAISKIPKKPGVYFYKNISGDILYIGKAKNLKNRIKQYLTGTDGRPQIPFLMKEAKQIEYTVVDTELESLYLERTLIQKYSPKYNIELRDDKNYAFITINFASEIPQFSYARKFDPLNKNIKYFGPFTAAEKIKETLNLVRKIFSYCLAENVSHKPCFYFHLHRCPGVCIGKIGIDEYKKHLEKIVAFLKGETSAVEQNISREMIKAAKNKKFETAAKLRDQLRALKYLLEKQNVILSKKIDLDLVSLAENTGVFCVNLFKIRDGKMQNKENFVYTDPTKTTKPSEVMQKFLEYYYLETSFAPKQLYIENACENQKLITQIIKTRFQKRIHINIPQKGQIKKLIALGKINAKEFLNNWLNEKTNYLDKVYSALNQLKTILHLPSMPKRIECFDISNIQGTNAVGSMVVFENGLPKKSEYRKFKIQTNPPTGGPDDFAMMREILSRRLNRIMDNEASVAKAMKDRSGIKNKWPFPDLIVIDGGKGQLNAVLSVIHDSRLHLPSARANGGQAKFIIPIIGLAKKQEEIYLPNKKSPIIIPHNNPALQLLQRVRDEAHRFGITFHRNLRSKQAVKSALDGIPGIGPKTKKLLKQKIGTVAEIKKTNLDELSAVVGKKLASAIKQTL